MIGNVDTSLELLGSHFGYSLDAVEVFGRDEVTKIELLGLREDLRESSAAGSLRHPRQFLTSKHS